jgi:predicted Ser/Thr protein kinase
MVARRPQNDRYPSIRGKPLVLAQALIGTALGNVKLQKVLGQGELGVVFLAQQSPADPPVAVKVLSPATAQTSSQRSAFLERFRHEINIISSLDHRQILPVFEYGKHDGLAYLVMPYISGGSLQRVIEHEGRLQLSTIANYLDQVAAALDYAHKQGVLHLGLKPNNVLLNANNHLFLTDFGQVNIAIEKQTPHMRLLIAGTPAGPPDYMAPEQMMGDGVDSRADLYSLGVMLFQMVTGQTPFQGDPLQIAMQHVQSSPPSPKLLREDVPQAAEQVILRALARSPLDRYSSVLDLSSAFRAALTSAHSPVSVPRKRGLFDPVWQKAAPVEGKALVTSEQSAGTAGTAGTATGLLSAAGMAAFRPNAPAPLAVNEQEPKEPAAYVSEAPKSLDTPLPATRLRLGFKSGNLLPIDNAGVSPVMPTTREADPSATTGEVLRSSIAPLPSTPTTSKPFSPAPFTGQAAQLTKPLPAPDAEQNTTGAMALPRAPQAPSPSSFPASGVTAEGMALKIPGGEIGPRGTVKLTEPVKVVQVPVAGQPGRFVTGFLPVLPPSPSLLPTESPEKSNGTTKDTPSARNYKKLLMKIAAPLLVLLVLISSGSFWFLHMRATVPTKTGVQTEKLNPNWQAIAAAQATATANANYILTDPLQQNIHNWPIAQTGNKTYLFKNGAYHVADNDPHQSAPALLPGIVLKRPLAYTLTMQEIKGNDSSINNSFGMIIFLNTQVKNNRSVITFYSFGVVNNKGGVYQFLKYDSSKGQSPYSTIWQHAFSGEFHQGASHANTFKVRVNGKYFTFWVNNKKVGSAQDSSIGSGQIGMLVNLKGTEVAFSNLQLTYN